MWLPVMLCVLLYCLRELIFFSFIPHKGTSFDTLGVALEVSANFRDLRDVFDGLVDITDNADGD